MLMRAIPGGCELDVWVVAGSSRSAVGGLHGGAVKVRVAAPAERGRANAAVVALLTQALGVDVELVAGTTGRRKVVRVHGLGPAEVARRLGL